MNDQNTAAVVFWYSHSVYIVFNTLCTLLHLALGDLIKQVLKCCTNLDTYLAGGCYMLCMLISPPLGKNVRRAKREHSARRHLPVQDILSLHVYLNKFLLSPPRDFFIISEGFIVIRQVCHYKVQKELSPPHTHTPTSPHPHIHPHWITKQQLKISYWKCENRFYTFYLIKTRPRGGERLLAARH